MESDSLVRTAEASAALAFNIATMGKILEEMINRAASLFAGKLRASERSTGNGFTPEGRWGSCGSRGDHGSSDAEENSFEMHGSG